MSQSLRFAPVAASLVLAVAAGCGNDVKIPKLSDIQTGSSTTGSGGTSGTSGTSGNGPVDLTCPNIALDASGTPMGGAPASRCDTSAKISCMDAPTQQFDPHTMPGYTQPADTDAQVTKLLGSLDKDGKIAQMQGVPYNGRQYSDIERSPDQGSIRGYRYRDAGRGVNLDAGQDNRKSDGKDYSTVFPTESVRAASWDLDLEFRVGAAMGDEVVASRNNMLLAPCMNIIRHPYWGRTQETYSEDMYHTGRMASAFTAGLQTYVTGCAKHFAANNVERDRKDQDAIMNDQTLREIYGRHFEMVVNDGGIGCIMASYNKINEVKSTQNHHLLTDILRKDFRYKGVIISDWWAMPSDQDADKVDAQTQYSLAIQAVQAGLNIEVPWILYFSHLSQAVDDGALSPTDIDQAARYVLTQKYRFGSANVDPAPWGLQPASANSALVNDATINNVDHQALAEETEIKSAVLLSNGTGGDVPPVLPFGGASSTKPKIAVIGQQRTFALKSGSCPDQSTNLSACSLDFVKGANLGDRGSSRVNGDPNVARSVFQGLTDVGMSHGTTSVTSGTDATAVGDADAVVVVVGLTAGDEGEEYAIKAGGDRTTLDLPNGQNDLVTSVLALGKPTVIIVESGSIQNLPWLSDPNHNQATIWAGYPGIWGGSALAKLIFADGGANFSGKMPMAWAHEADLPLFTDTANGTTTNMGYFFGYRYYDNAGKSASLVFPFGHGLSYTTFAYKNLSVGCSDTTKSAIVNVSVDIQNTGTVDGYETAMLFVAPPLKPAGVLGDRPVKELKSFKKVFVQAGHGVRTTMQLRIQDLRRWEGDDRMTDTGKWLIDSGDYTIMVGKDAADADLSNPAVLKDTLKVFGD